MGDGMARTDAIVLGAGIVGTSIALHLAKRGASVALIDRAGLGEQTSYGNAGIIEGNTVFPPAFPSDLGALARIALKRAGEANYHLSFLPQIAPWLLAFRAASRPQRLVENARLIRPLFARAVAEHEALMAEAGATHYLRKTGWLKVYRSERAFAALKPEFDLAAQFGLPLQALDTAGAQALEPSLNPVFAQAVFWPQAASVSNPLGVTRAYAARFAALGGITLQGDARSLHRAGNRWRVETNEGGIDAPEVVVALGPWALDLLAPLGLKLPLMVKRGYHRHFKALGNATLARPVLDAGVGYVITPMEQGIRMTTGVEFAAARCGAVAGAVRPHSAKGARTVSARRTRRRQNLAGQPTGFSGFAPGDRASAAACRTLARHRPRPLGPHARAGHRTHDCRDDGG